MIIEPILLEWQPSWAKMKELGREWECAVIVEEMDKSINRP